MPKLTEYLHTAAAAEYIRVAQNTLRKWAARGDIPMHRNPANDYRLLKRTDSDRLLVNASMSPVNRMTQTPLQEILSAYQYGDHSSMAFF